MTQVSHLIDAHQHFWSLERADYGWITADSGPIYRDFLPQDLIPMLKKRGIKGTILVQAAPSIAETHFMLSLAQEHSFIKGVVGWIDFEAENGAELISTMAENSKLVGLRPMIQDVQDPNWMLQASLTPSFEALIAADLTFDALVLPVHLENLQALLARHPLMRTVIDHSAKPAIRDHSFDDWAHSMTQLAHSTQAFCKLSGLVTEAAKNWKWQDLRPYTDHLLSTFGPERLIWGSDWPVCTLAASYEDWCETTDTLLAGLSSDNKNAILGENALRAYQTQL